MNTQTIVSPEDQSVTFVELFFDLVFVFSVTQVVGLLHHELNWTGVLQAVLVFWLVWWAWTQFTWALNAADTTHHLVELGALVATAVAFFMAVALPDAFQSRALWFAIPYVLVRVVGLALFVGGMAVAVWRATRRLLLPRLILILGTAGLVMAVTGIAPLWTLAIALLGVVIIAALEQRAKAPG